jgi:Tfp pilus tip-associated adhesin PilY1
MFKILRFLCPLPIIFFLFMTAVGYAGWGGYGWGEDETDIFAVSGKTDALILLDLSGSMAWDPAGNTCSTTGCSRLEIAKAAIRKVLDANSNGVIDSTDEDKLAVRIGYMRFYSCLSDDTLNNYSSGCISLIRAIGSKYADIYTSVKNEYASGGTPLASALNEAKLYLDAHKAADPYKNCSQKFVILITDGADTFACAGNGGSSQLDQYKRRKATVAKAKAVADAGYKVFVIGFGANMPDIDKNTLNWAAYYGGTDNPSEENSGDTSVITPSADPCSTDTTNDPGNASLSGYAYLAANADQLNAALSSAITIISEFRYSFSVSSVSSMRTVDGNYLYEPSFRPHGDDPFWPGFLKRYTIGSDGSISATPDWDAGTLLASRTPGSRNILTYKDGALTAFNTSNITPGDLGLPTYDTSGRNAIVGYIRGESAYNPDNGKLGDMFHSNPVTIGSPSPFYIDSRSPNAYINFRNNTQSREKVIVVGANDGQFHAFQTSDGYEKWSFIPPNLLPKVGYIAHSKHPTALSHQFFVDGPVTVADVWLGTGDGTNKSESDWRTLLVFGEGKGVRDSSNVPSFLWSSSPSCDSGFKKKYDYYYRFYCGYYAFDITDTANPPTSIKWRLQPTSDQAKYIDEPWSKMAVGRVKIDGKEKWLGFIGGGYNTQGKYDDDDDYSAGRRGKGFFVVDLSNGSIPWDYSKDDNSKMDYTIPASPAVPDTDNDGFIDVAYLGDLGGNMWRFTFCTQQDEPGCNINNWRGGMLFDASSAGARPVFTSAAVAKDASSQLWVFWGTGDKQDPTSRNDQDKFFAVIDSDRTSTYKIDNLQDITTGTYSGVKQGWYLKLTDQGEKMLADPAVFAGMVLFTTYTPGSSSDPCGGTSGTAKLYAMAMMPIAINGITYNPGAGVLSEPSDKTSKAGGQRSITLGSGIPSAPIISQKPSSSGTAGTTDLYVSVSGAPGQDTALKSSSQLPDSPLLKRLKSTPPRAQIIHWRDRRIQ